MAPSCCLALRVVRSVRVVFSLAATVLTAGFGLIAVPPAAQAQTAAVSGNWVRQLPATSPSAREESAMAYDAATNTVVLFGGLGSSNLGDTWTYNGTTWTQQSPATSPPARAGATMAYDAATGTVVLFGGNSGSYLADTWTWNGTTWTQQSPATSPPPRAFPAMAYSAASGTLVLFGGSNGSALSDTWTYNGTTWTQQSPATSPSARYITSMSYNAAAGTEVLFGGYGGGVLADTWTYNGTTWTQQSPATSPSARDGETMSYDPATGNVVLFGGFNGSAFADTWTYNGTTWTQQSPTTSPPARHNATMAYNTATGTVVLFGGVGSSTNLADTWTYAAGAFVAPSSNVGTAAAQTPVYFNITATGTLGTTQVLTQGAAGLDFTLGTGSTCTGSATGPCQINVAFTPQAPGQRLGAVNLTNSSGAVIATAYISGIGTGPLATLTPGLISTVAGNGVACTTTTSATAPCGDGSAATSAQVEGPTGVAFDGAGNMYIADENAQRIRKVTAATGIISTVAGTGTGGYSAAQDGGPATAAMISSPIGIAVDGAGNLYFGEQGTYRLRKVTAATGIISTVAGTGTSTYTASQDGGPATAANVFPNGVSVDGAGNLYIADYANDRVRKVTAATGFISTVAGGGASPGSCAGSTDSVGDGCQATAASLSTTRGVAVDAAGNVFIADWVNNRVRKVTAATGIITTLAGTSTGGYTASQDGGPATAASLHSPFSVAVDAGGNVYIADQTNNRIREITAATGIISTVAGTGSTAYAASQDTGTTAATAASLYNPPGITVDSAGNLYIVDQNHQRIRKVSVTGEIVFPTATTAGTADTTDGTLTLTVNNIGNAGLNFTTQTESGASFVLGNPNTGGCSTAVPVAAGGSCVLGATFAPIAGTSGLVTGQVVLTDNSLNITGATQNVLLLGSTAANTVLVTVNSMGVITGSSTVTITFTYGGSGSLGDTGAPSATVNGSATGVGTMTCKGKPAHEVCTFPYTGPALATAGNYAIVVSVAADSTYAAASANGTLRVSASGAVAPIGGPVQAGDLLVPTVVKSYAAGQVPAPGLVWGAATLDAPASGSRVDDGGVSCGAVAEDAMPQEKKLAAACGR